MNMEIKQKQMKYVIDKTRNKSSITLGGSMGQKDQSRS